MGEMAKMAASQAKANDPHLLTELEQLRTLRDKYENTLAEININNSNLKNQINQQTEEISSIKKQLSSSSDKVSQLSSSNTNLEKALVAKSEEIQSVTAELKNLKSKPQEQPAILNNNNINVAAIEEELASVKKNLATKETEVLRLNGEIETLQEQVSNTVTDTVNGHSEADTEWKDKYQQLNLDHEKMLVKLKGLQSDLDSEVSSYKGQMESLKSKNNDLRGKNRKAIEALNDLEQKYVKLLKEKMILAFHLPQICDNFCYVYITIDQYLHLFTL